MTYATLNPNPSPGAGPEGLGVGVGVVDEYSTDGRLIARIATGDPLDAPWGLAIAPSGWGRVAGSLLVGNFGNGRISIFPARGDHFAHHASGQILDTATGQPFAEPGLWGLLPARRQLAVPTRSGSPRALPALTAARWSKAVCLASFARNAAASSRSPQP